MAIDREDPNRDDLCDACQDDVAQSECGHGILCIKCYIEVHGSVEADCDAL